jgi:hypothetical protein
MHYDDTSICAWFALHLFTDQLRNCNSCSFFALPYGISVFGQQIVLSIEQKLIMFQLLNSMS